jgi:hypothetical protein
MKKLQLYKLVNFIAVPISLIFFYYVLYQKPGIAFEFKMYRYLYIWLILISVGGMLINNYYYNLLTEIKNDEKLSELLSHRGRIHLRREPLYFFTQEQFDRYKKWQRFTAIFFIFLTALLFLVLNLYKFLPEGM